MRSVKVNGVEYPVIEINGRMRNAEWDDRESKTIILEMTYAQAMAIFDDGTEWSIIEEWEDPDTHETHREEYDNSDFNIAGDVTDHRDDTMSITMGKATDLEDAYELLYGGE